MTQRQSDETLEKLSRGIEESRRTAQHRAMELAQEYFGDSVEALKRQMEESRSRLERLPDEIPGGRDEPFQALFGELMESYSKLEDCLDESEKNVAGMDLARLESPEETAGTTRPREVEDTDAAHREAQRRGVDLDEVEGTGTGGRVVAEDVRSDEERQTGRPEATDAARREARDRGIDLDEVEATGAEGQIIVSDVVGSAGNVSDLARSPVSQTEGVAGEVTDTAAGVLGEATRQGGERRGGQTPAENDRGESRATDAARRKAEDLGVSLSEVTGTGSGGETTVSDVTGVAEDDRGAAGRTPMQTGGERGEAQEAARQTDVPGEPFATKAARRRAEKSGVDLSRVEGTGTRGLITIEDVMGAQNG